MTRLRPRIAAALATALAVGIGALSGCAPAPAPSAAPLPSTQAPAQPSDPADETSAEPEPLSCENLITPTLVDSLSKEGWSFDQRPFTIGPRTLEEGMTCYWADFTRASDVGQMYGWAPIDAATAAEAQQELEAQGWLREDGPQGVYLTVDPTFAMNPDDNGYGMTYLFSDGWVAVSDTKQGLVLIVPEH